MFGSQEGDLFSRIQDLLIQLRDFKHTGDYQQDREEQRKIIEQISELTGENYTDQEINSMINERNQF